MRRSYCRHQSDIAKGGETNRLEKAQPMFTRHLAAGMIAAVLASGSAATAADLSSGYPEQRYGSAYDDPRYADIYRDDTPPRREPYQDSYRGDRDDDDDDDDGRDPRSTHGDSNHRSPQAYLPPMRPTARYTYNGRHHGDGCVPRHLIKQQLRAEGWSDFHDLELTGNTAHVRARRPSGRLFELKVDRCTGEIVNARPFGPHIYGQRRYSRAY